MPPPVITSATTRTIDTDTAFSYTITATNSPTEFSATKLPAGLTINKATGVISGSIAIAATYTINLFATNAGGTGRATLTLTVNKKYVAPLINWIKITYGANAGYVYSGVNEKNKLPATFAGSRYTNVLSYWNCYSSPDYAMSGDTFASNGDGLLTAEYPYSGGNKDEIFNYPYYSNTYGYTSMWVNVQGYLNKYGPSPINLNVSYLWTNKYDCDIFSYRTGCSVSCYPVWIYNGTVYFHVTTHETTTGPALSTSNLTYGPYSTSKYLEFSGGFNIGLVFQANGTRTVAVNN